MCRGVAPTLLLLTLCGVLTAAREWGAWKAWTECQLAASSCGPGKRSRERVCESGQCAGEWKEGDICFGPPCSNDNSAIWTFWSEWTVCTSPSCSVLDGHRRRWRECRGSKCPTNKVQSFTENCTTTLCKKDGAWSGWSVWSACSATCGQGYHYRQRSCTGVQHGGDLCTGSDYHTKACLTPHVCYREASWSPWGIWYKIYDGDHPCRERKRMCEQPYPLDPAKSICPGTNTEAKDC